MEILKNNVREIAGPIITEAGCYLVDIQGNLQGANALLKILVQHENGITLDMLTSITRKLKNLESLDELFPGGYRLEVSSPGADYPLKDPRDLKRSVGRNVEVHHHADQFQTPVSGLLTAVTEAGIELELKKEKRSVNFNDLDYVKILFKF